MLLYPTVPHLLEDLLHISDDQNVWTGLIPGKKITSADFDSLLKNRNLLHGIFRLSSE